MVRDLDAIDHLTQWAAVLRGALVAVPLFLRSGGASGPCVAFFNATASRRTMFVSRGFREENPQLAAAIGLAPGEWKVWARAMNWLRSPNTALNIGLLTATEQAKCKRKHAFNSQQALTFLARRDHARSTLGLGRA